MASIAPRFVWTSLVLLNVGVGRAATINVLAPDLEVVGKDWRHYDMGDSPEGGYMGWLHKGVTSIRGRLALPGCLRPGVHFVFVKAINYGEGVSLAVRCGGGRSDPVVPRNRDWNGYWTDGIRLPVQTDGTVLDLVLHKVGDASMPQKLLVRGIYVTDDPDVVVDRNDTAIAWRYPTAADDTPTVKGNLIPNSSFEAGIGHGWGVVPSPNNRDYAIASLWDRVAAHHGRVSMRIPARGRLVSRVIRVSPNKKHTVSLWAAPCDRPTTLRVSLTNVHGRLRPPKPASHLHDTFALEQGWQRVSVSGPLLDYPTAEYQLAVTAGEGAARVDALQLEEGALSAYRPMAPVEIGLRCDRPGNVFLADEPAVMRLLAHNATTKAVSTTVGYEIYDVLNRKVKAGSVKADLPANATWGTGLDVATGKTGSFRIVIWVEGHSGTDEEVVYAVVPSPRVAGADERSIVGIHANASACQYETLGRLGVKWQRIMSPTAWFRWRNVEPAPGQFVWYDEEVRKTASQGLTILGTIGTNDYWPAWADRDGKPDLDAWERFVHAIVAHYRPWVKHWEIWNEPIYQFSPPFYAEMLRRAARSIRRADPQAKIVGMGGSYRCDWCVDVIKHLGGRPSEYMDIVATHIYPAPRNLRKPNRGERAREFRDRIVVPHGLPVWNTETGAWCLGFYKGPNSGFRSPGEALWPHGDAVRYYRGSSREAERVAINFLHSIGNGLSRYFYYDSRFHASPDYYKAHPTIVEFDDTIRPKGVAYAILAHRFDHSVGLGNVSPDAHTLAYLFDRGGTPLVALWSADARPKSMVMDLDRGSFAAYDMMGNALRLTGTTLRYGRQPLYLEGKRGLAIAAMRAAVTRAVISDVPDETPPNVSVSDAPRGPTPEAGVRIRWIAIDDTSVPANTCSNALQYAYRLVGRDPAWSTWTARTFVDYEGLRPKPYRFEVRARDAAGNTSPAAAREFQVTATCPAR